jgi:acyl carrier protein
MTLTKKKLIYFIKNGAEPKIKIKHNTPLFSNSLLDSIFLLDIVMFIEVQENIKVENTHINLKNFDSIDRILTYIQSAKLGTN